MLGCQSPDQGEEHQEACKAIQRERTSHPSSFHLTLRPSPGLSRHSSMQATSVMPFPAAPAQNPLSAKSISYPNPFPTVSCITPPLFRELYACSLFYNAGKALLNEKKPLLCESPTPLLLGTHCCNMFLQDLSLLKSQ